MGFFTSFNVCSCAVSFNEQFFLIFLIFVIFFISLLINFGFFSILSKTIYKNYIYFIILLVIFLFIMIKLYPFSSLIAYDEENYLLVSRSIVEYGVGGLCFNKESGVCSEFLTTSHGLGSTFFYSLVYNSNYEIHYRNAVMLNMFFAYMSSILIFIISLNLFNKKQIAFISSALLLFFPINITFSTSLMPSILSLFFFMLFILFLIYSYQIKENSKSKRISIFISLFALLLLSFLRIEYFLIVVLFAAFYLIKNNNLFLRNKLKKYDCMYIASICVYTILSFFHFINIVSNKIGSDASLNYINSSYFAFFFSNIFIFILSIFFILSFFVSRDEALSFKKYRQPKLVLLTLFFSILFFYSTYNYQSVYRFLIPISSIYILFSSAGIFITLNLFFKQKSILFLFCLF